MGSASRGEEEKKTMKRVAGVGSESLGWLTESTIMPKKHKAIQGVGASSIMELKAELYKSQEDSKKSKDLSGSAHVDYRRAKKKVSASDPFARKNSGVDDRAHLDKLALKAVSDGSASYAALEKKAELYEKLAKGELSDEEDKEKYCVDFFHKGLTEDEPKQQNNSISAEVPLRENNDNDDFISLNSKSMGLGRTTGTIDMDEHRRFIKEVHEEANQAREKVSEVKLRRQEHAAARREKLKQAYLRKRLENLKAAAAAATATKQDQT